MILSETLFIFLSFFLLMTLPYKARSHPPGSIDFFIDSFNPIFDGLIYERDAFVPPGSTHVSLVATDASGHPRTSSVGRVLYPDPIKLWDEERQASFEATIKFRIGPIDNNNPADGMTFFMVPVNSTKPTGGEGGNLGIFNAVNSGSPIFAVEFDTYVNSPGDPSFRHVGIDINSKVSAKTTRFENATGQIVTAYVNYDGPLGSIIVVAEYGSSGFSQILYYYDLKTLLPQQVQIGISASTGPSLVANFDVFSWHFTSDMLPDIKDTHIKQYVE